MAGAGDKINWSNIVALQGTSWYYSTNKRGEDTFYISAPAFRVHYYIGTYRGDGTWGTINVYPYDSSTGAFSSSAVFSESGSSDEENSVSWTWDHNYKGGSSGDIHDCHLWKVVFSCATSGACSYQVYTGGMGCMTESIYNSYFKGRKIYYSTCDYWEKGNTYSSDSAFLSGEGYSVRRGTPISVSSGTYKYLCAKNT